MKKYSALLKSLKTKNIVMLSKAQSKYSSHPSTHGAKAPFAQDDQLFCAASKHRYWKINSLFGIFFFIICFAGIISAQPVPHVYINEFLTSNLTTNPEMVDFSDFSDWIELYNDESTDVNIGGFYLSDDFSLPTKWQIPVNTIIPAKGYFLVWADEFNDIPGKNYTRPLWPNAPFTTQWCHTNFKLSKDHEKIGLFNASSVIVDTITYHAQVTDVSFGRKPDGSTSWYYFSEPSPLNSNSGTGLLTTEYSGNVLFSAEGGFYPSTIQLTLSSSSGSGVIRYTTTGSQPNSSSPQYSSPLTIDANMVVRARVFENSKLPGRIGTNSYFVNETQNLPSVSLVTDPNFLWGKLGIYKNSYKEREIPVSLEYFPINSPRGFVMDAGARIGGENIFRFAQKPFNIFARADYGTPHIEYKVFDNLPYQQFKELYLRNGGSEWTNTIMRDGTLQNVLKDRISNSMMAYKPSALYLNGQYWGISDIREKVNEQYFFLHYNVDPANLDHIEDTYKIITGDSTDFVNLVAYVESSDLSDSSTYAYVQSKIDIHDLMDFVIVQDFIANTSWGHNREMWRDRVYQPRWRWVLVDLDRGYDASNISLNAWTSGYYPLSNFTLFEKLLTNTGFKNEFIQRYSYHLNTTFNTARVVAIIDSIQALLVDEMPRHIQKWGTLIDSLSIDGGFGKQHGINSMSFWNTEVQKFRDFASQRPPYAVQYLNSRLGLTGRANLKVTSNVPTPGKLIINGFYQNLGEDIPYFKNIPVTLQAFPPQGYVFKQWVGFTDSNATNIFPAGSLWKYRDENSAPLDTWKNIAYDDASWKSGNAQLGYGDGDETTVIGYGADANNKYITSYYRRTFNIADPSLITELKLKLLRDDGAVVYLNGVDVGRSNMPAGSVTYSTLAAANVASTDETTFFDLVLDHTGLVAGTNVIAIEIHQAAGNSTDVSFDASLDATLTHQSQVKIVLGTKQPFTYSISKDTELQAEFEAISSSDVPQVINSATTFTKANSPYYAKENVTVESNGVLTVEPGSEIYFSSGKGMTVKGTLLMKGTKASPIIITSYYANEKWGALCFDSSKGTSELRFVDVSHSTNGNDSINFFAGVSSYKSTVHLSNVHFHDLKSPISTQWSDMIIDSCLFENITNLEDYLNCNGGNITISNSTFIGNALSDMDAIDLGFNTGTTNIHHNIIRDFTGSNSDAIDLGDASYNVIISDNIISNCSDKGVSVGQGSNVTINRNVISGCNLGVGIKDSLSHAEITNCTFFANNVGVACFEKVLNRGGGSANVKGSIFANSNDAPYTIDALSSINISYSLSNTNTLPGVANIVSEPYLINPEGGNYHLQTQSPCIDKGDPSIIDTDSSRSDIGAFMYAGASQPDVVINEINYNSATNFDSDDWVELYNTTNSAIDISGWVFMDENRTPSFVIKPGTILSANSYLVLCRNLIMFTAKYPSVVNNVGNLLSGLGGSGEVLFLYNNSGKLVDSLSYRDTAPWPTGADGAGSSAELVNPLRDNSIGANWKASVGHGTPGTINSTYIANVDDNGRNILPTSYALHQNFPNPFNPSTTIKFEIPSESNVQLTVFDMLGRQIAEIASGQFTPGYYSCTWNASSISGGVYFLRMNAQGTNKNANYTAVKKLVLLK